VLGASRGGLIGQFLGETAILVFAAMILGVVASILLIPQLASWLDIAISTHELARPMVIVLLAGLAVFIILMAGLYPAFVLSAFRPAVSLKSASPVSSRGLTLRKSLVVLQFGISQLMIIGTIVVARQMDYFQNRDLGFNKESVISFDVADSAHRQVLWQKLAANPGVTAISFSSGAPGYNSNFSGFGALQLGVTGEHVTEVKLIDEHYIRMFGMKMLAGDTIARRTGKDSTVPVVVNETMVQELNLKDPRSAIGQRFEMDGDHCRIIGVIQDFQSETKHKKRRSCVLLYNENGLWSASARISPVGMHQTIARIGRDWSALYPDLLFSYEFLDDHIASLYRQEQRVFTAFRLFSCIAILIGCLGLYGLIAFATLQRTREVGIRKVLGATVPDILLLFGREFIVLIALAFVIAAPVAWFAMHSWLENFAYRIGIGWEIFVLSIGSSFLIAAFTISYKSVAAALTQPAKSLKTE